jgi:nitroimidazol reductase NimA-like FMN-containing flavoprotein (pyridoxamine 5'-phosphate oxidase superfamily)
MNIELLQYNTRSAGGSQPVVDRPDELVPSDRTRIKRLPERGRYERATVEAILDEGFVCHLGFTTERGPVVIPTSYGRVDDRLYIHGSPASRMLRSLKTGIPVCVTVTLIDGLVLARSTVHHSINYRSVVVFGEADEVTDPAEKHAALAAFVEHVIPGRTTEARPATDKEVKGTLVLALPLSEASAKVRGGPPVDDADDLGLSCWAGVLPLAMQPGAPQADEHVAPGTPVAASIASYQR